MQRLRDLVPLHVVFLALIALIAAAGGWRLASFAVRLQALHQRRESVALDAQYLEQLQTAMLQVDQAWLDFAGGGGVVAWADFRLSMHQLQGLARARPSTSSPLWESVDLHQFQLLLAAEYERFAAANDAPSRDLPPLRYVDLASLWGNLNTLVMRSQSRVNEDLGGLFSRALAEAAVVFLSLVALAILYHNRVNRALDKPLQELATTARRVRRGNLSERATPMGDDKVRSLAQDFNRMVDILVDSLVHEEQVVEELKRKTVELEAANRHKSQFLASVSHELKTPLNAIIGFADILGSGHHGELSARQSDYIARIGQAGKHLLGMISDLIDVAKIEAGRLELKPWPFSPAELLSEMAKMMAPQLEAKGHALEVTAPEPAVSVMLDPARVRQILLNLLGNAVKFTPEGGKLRLAAEVTGGELVLTMTDNGIGIAEADQQRVFEDFVQLDSRLQRQHEGTGIGLALTRRLARLMGGDIALDSTPGEGSTFVVRLPLPPPKADADPAG